MKYNITYCTINNTMSTLDILHISIKKGQNFRGPCVIFCELTVSVSYIKASVASTHSTHSTHSAQVLSRTVRFVGTLMLKNLLQWNLCMYISFADFTGKHFP